MNDLGAKILKAELMGNEVSCFELKMVIILWLKCATFIDIFVVHFLIDMLRL